MAISDNIRLMKNFWRKYGILSLVGLLALVFFVATSSFNYFSQSPDYVKWSSPDETANYFFIRSLAETGELSFYDRAAAIGADSVLPRSMRSDAGWIKPVSFLGIILIYGGLASLFGTVIIPFLTPLFAALGIILFFLIARRLFNERVGLWSAFILASFPVYIYYTARSMFHNVLFVVLLLAALYLFLLALEAHRRWPSLLAALGAGFCAGLAVITRTSELLWLAPVLLLIGLCYLRRLGAYRIVLAISGFLTALAPAMYYNKILYGSFLFGGYNEMNRSLESITRAGGEFLKFTWQGQFVYYRDCLAAIFHNIFYFGFNASQSLAMFQNYLPKMFPALSILALLGFILLVVRLIRRREKKFIVYILSGLILTVILAFYYGSWKFSDNPDKTHFTIGNSYTRYWLPIYLFLMPLAALAITKLGRALSAVAGKLDLQVKKLISFGFQVVIVASLAAVSIIFVLYGSEEGLAYLYNNNQAEKATTEFVWWATPADSIIITRYNDKFFWPERRVIVGSLPDAGLSVLAAKLVKHYPVYYYGFYFSSADVKYLNENRLAAYNLSLRLISKTNINSGLYALEAAPVAETTGAAKSVPQYEKDK